MTTYWAFTRHVGPLLLVLALPALGLTGTFFPGPTHVDVFTSGIDYNVFRIPAIETAPDGSLLAFAEGRESLEDPGPYDIDLVYKRSTDGGTTWSSLQVFDDPGSGWAASNPATVVDRDTGRIWTLYNRWEPGHDTDTSQPGTSNNQSWARFSDDNGVNWSTPIDLTMQARDFNNWGATYFGPGGAIQASNGRLLFPSTREPDGDGDLSSNDSYVLYSDDHGATWQRGQTPPRHVDGRGTNENQLVELEDGRIMMDARQYLGGTRRVAFSSDVGATWTQATTGQAVFPVATAIERYTSVSKGDDINRILWTGPEPPPLNRENLVVRVSYDEGKTFTNEHQIYDGPSSYSDMTILKDNTVGVLWERGDTSANQFITFTNFGLGFLEPQPPSNDSTTFEHRYEGDIVNAANPQIPGYHQVISPAAHMSTDGNLLTMVSSTEDSVYESDDWANEARDAKGWTWEMRFKVGADEPDKTHLILRLGDGENSADNPQQNLWIYANRIFDTSVTQPRDVFTGDLTDDFHTFRVAQEAASNVTRLWMDGQFIGLAGDGILSGGEQMWFGGASSVTRGTISIDYIRWTGEGGFAPPIVVPMLGDVNNDGFVDIFDVNVVSANWGTAGPAGDANGDGNVDIFDINLISSNWSPPAGGGAESAVPEPATWISLMLSAMALVAYRR
jgi:sialidase-1